MPTHYTLVCRTVASEDLTNMTDRAKGDQVSDPSPVEYSAELQKAYDKYRDWRSSTDQSHTAWMVASSQSRLASGFSAARRNGYEALERDADRDHKSAQFAQAHAEGAFNRKLDAYVEKHGGDKTSIEAALKADYDVRTESGSVTRSS